MAVVSTSVVMNFTFSSDDTTKRVRKRQFIKTVNGNITHPLLREILHRWGGTHRTPLMRQIHIAYLQAFIKIRN